MCPCRSAGHPCTQRCSCGKRRLCANREPEGNESNDTDETDGEPLSKSIRPTTIAQARQDSHAVSVKKFVMDLQRADLERVTVQLLCRFPDVYLDAVAAVEPSQTLERPGPSNQPPSWCRCTRCVPMPTEIESVCCRLRTCVTTAQFFTDAVINGNVLAAGMAANKTVQGQGGTSHINGRGRGSGSRCRVYTRTTCWPDGHVNESSHVNFFILTSW
nr:uncharacterized protein LOC129267296 [Lytechinus pictus]